MEAREATATGESCMRVDAIAKVTGRARYTDDYVMAGMCYAKYVRSPIAHGYAVSINDEEARSLPGVLAIFTWEDVPDIPFATAGHAWTLDENKRDTADRGLLTRHVRHHGDAVAIVVARDELTAENAAQLVNIEWQNYRLSPHRKRHWQKTLHKFITAAICLNKVLCRQAMSSKRSMRRITKSRDTTRHQSSNIAIWKA